MSKLLDIASLQRDFMLDAPTALVVYLSDDAQLSVRYVPQDERLQRIAKQLEGKSLQRACVALGAFDGVHMGHRRLLDACVNQANDMGALSVACTFNPDPDVVVSAHPASKITTARDRIRLLASSGVDVVVVVEFTPAVATLSHEEFFEGLLGRYFDIAAIHVGENFRMGSRGVCDVSCLAVWGAQRSIEVVGHTLARYKGAPISSSRIRAELEAGNLEDAHAMLGRHFCMSGCVESGRGYGHEVGIPTANVDLDETLVNCSDGVYGCVVLVDGWVYPAATNVGVPPTFAHESHLSKLEPHLLGFDENIYGKYISVAFIERYRDPVVFRNDAHLIEVIGADIARTEQLFGAFGVCLSA